MDILQPLRVQRAGWECRPLVRAIYHSWYADMARELSAIPGPTVEVGSGIGTLKEYMPHLVATDVMETPWTDQVANASHLPYPEAWVSNLVMVDVLHHLPEPMRFFEEARRVLVPGGRVVMLEPFCSPLSIPLWRVGHPEPIDMRADPFSGAPQTDANPWDANIALPTLIFWRDLERFRSRFSDLAVIRRRRFSWLLYPLSGGLAGRQLVVRRWEGALRSLEAALPLSRLAAFRCMVVLERQGTPLRPRQEPRESPP